MFDHFSTLCVKGLKHWKNKKIYTLSLPFIPYHFLKRRNDKFLQKRFQLLTLIVNSGYLNAILQRSKMTSVQFLNITNCPAYEKLKIRFIFEIQSIEATRTNLLELFVVE